MASTKFLSLLPIVILLSSAAAVAAIGDGAGTTTITGSRDITKILEQFPNFSTMKDLLTQSKLADEINSRQSITILAVQNSAISSVSSLPADVQKKVLSVHVVLDYYDLDKISNLPGSTAQLTTLLQASGKATGKTGFLNASDVGDSIVKIGSAVPGAGQDSEVVQMLAQQPYNISIIEISQPIIPPGIASAGNASPSNSTSGSHSNSTSGSHSNSTSGSHNNSTSGSSSNSTSGTSSNSSTTPSPAPKAATESPAPKAATPAPKAASTPAATPTSSPKASTPAPSAKPATPNDTAPAPAKKASLSPAVSPSPSKDTEVAPSEAPVVSPSAESPAETPTDASTAPISDTSGPGPAGIADKASAAAGNSVAGLGIALATWAAFLGAL